MNSQTCLRPHACCFVCSSRSLAHLVLVSNQATRCLLSKAAPPGTAWRVSRAQRQGRLKVMAIGFALGEGEEKPGRSTLIVLQRAVSTA